MNKKNKRRRSGWNTGTIGKKETFTLLERLKMTWSAGVSVEKTFYEGAMIANEKYILILVNTIIMLLTIATAGVTIIGLLIVPAIIGGYLDSLIRITRNQPAKIGDFFKIVFKKKRFWALTGGYYLAYLGILVGFVFLIVPGIYLSVAWLFVWYLLVDKDLSIKKTFATSRHLIHNKTGFWNTLVVSFLLTVTTTIVSLIPFYIGFIIIILLYPHIMMIYTVLYVDAVDRVRKRKGKFYRYYTLRFDDV